LTGKFTSYAVGLLKLKRDYRRLGSGMQVRSKLFAKVSEGKYSIFY